MHRQDGFSKTLVSDLHSLPELWIHLFSLLQHFPHEFLAFSGIEQMKLDLGIANRSLSSWFTDQPHTLLSITNVPTPSVVGYVHPGSYFQCRNDFKDETQIKVSRGTRCKAKLHIQDEIWASSRVSCTPWGSKSFMLSGGTGGGILCRVFQDRAEVSRHLVLPIFWSVYEIL